MIILSPSGASLSNDIDEVSAQLQAAHNRHFFDDDILVRGLEEPPVADPLGQTGWHFDNTGGGIKINWSIFQRNINSPTTNLTLGLLKGLYAILRTPLLTAPTGDYLFINVFTRRKNDGNDADANYRSRLNLVGDWTGATIGTWLVYYGQDLGVRPEIQRKVLASGISTIGPLEDDEEIQQVSLETSSSAVSGANIFTVQEAGFLITDYKLNCTFAMP